MNTNTKNDFLMHHGVKGMKWGVRKDPRVVSSKQRLRQANKQYSKDYNKAYSFSNRHPITQHIKKSKNYHESNKRWSKAIDSAEKLNKAKTDYRDTKKQVKVENYRNKLIKRAERRANSNNRMASSTKEDIDSLKKYGKRSNVYQDHISNEVRAAKSKAETEATTRGFSKNETKLVGYLAAGSTYIKSTSDESFDIYMSDLKGARSAYISTAKKYTNNRKALMNTKITKTTSKKDIRKIYRKGLSAWE